MASTYSTNLAIELIGTGDQAGSWGNTTNTNLGTLIEQAISGYVTQAVSTGTDTTITIPNGSSGVARNMYIELTGSGGASTNLIVPANKKLYFIFNNSTGAVTVKVSGQTGVSVPTGKKVVLTSNGTDVVNGLNYIADFASNSATITNLSATSATITNLTLTSLVISNLSIASANITTLTSSSATITNLLGTTLTISGNTFLATSSGNVGIGTASPTNKLNVSGNGYLFALNGGLTNRVAQTFGNTGGGLDLGIEGSAGGTVFTGGSSYAGVIGTNNATVLQLGTNGTIRATLDTSGNLGIGTASPSGKLDVLGGISSTSDWGNVNITSRNAINANNRIYTGLRFQDSGAGDAGAIGYAYDGTGYNVQFATVATVGGALTSRMTLDRSGNLGIGTASPTDKLNVGAFSGNNVITIGAATTGTSSVYFGDGTGADRYRGYIDYEHTNDRFVFGTSGTGKAYLDSSGNLGLGVTPNAWNAVYRAMNIGARGFIFSRTDNQETSIGVNWYRTTAAAFVYAQNGYATSYTQLDGVHAWYNSTNNTSGADAPFTPIQAMTLDASGNLGVGTTSPGNFSGTVKLVVGSAATTTTAGAVTVYSGTATYGGLYFADGTVGDQLYRGAVEYNHSTDALLLYSAGAERARITSGGDFLTAGKTTASFTTVGAELLANGQINTASANIDNLNLYNTTAAAYRFYVSPGGTVFATNTTISAISDQRLKENVRDLDVGLDAIMALKPRKFDWKEGKGQDKKDVRGFIAQEFEQVFPDLIDEWKDPAPEGEEPYKSVRQDLIPVLVKAIQELSAKVAALEAK